MNYVKQYTNHFLNAYSNFPRGQYVNLIIVRKTESEALFRTEGAGEDLTKELVHAGVADKDIIQRVVMTKRKQTAVERRTGRELLRNKKMLYSKDDKSGECALNRNNACEKCIDCMLYGYAVGGGGAQKSRIMTEDAYSILRANDISGKRTGNALFDDGTMRDPETKKPSQAIFEDPYIRPETHFLEVETLKDVTVGEFVYILGCILRSTRYGAVSSRQGRISNTLAGIIFSDCEIFSSLELTQHTYDALKKTNPEMDFPLHHSTVLESVNVVTKNLIKKIPSRKPIIVDLEMAANIQNNIVKIYNSEDKLKEILKAVEQSYGTDRAKAEDSHNQVLRSIEEALCG